MKRIPEKVLVGLKPEGAKKEVGRKIRRTVHEKAPGWRTQSLLRKDSGTILKVDSVGEESEGESCNKQSSRGAHGTHRPCEWGFELD